ncbi:MAG: T9SS type A sorting domain-containing protein [Flavobacteriaceae bacterium]|nr:T9SS type A sorting domain-containing protein [Flavobacteriaceae bacterium]
MKIKLLTIILFLISTTLYSQWEIVGGNSSYFTPNPGYGNGQSSSSIQLLQFHPQTNEPYVFFRHLTTNVAAGPSLIKFNGTNWEFISQQFDGPGAGNTSSADFFWGFYFRQDTNLPVVFYQDSYFEGGSTKYKYHVAQRVGNTWEEIMGADNKVVNDVFLGGHRVKMVRKPNTNLPVLIGNGPTQIPNGSKSMVVHFDTDTWSLLGDATFSGFGAYVSDIDYNTTTNIPYAIVSTLNANATATIAEVWYYQGSWQLLGNPGFVPANFGEGFRIRVNQLNGAVYVMSPEAYDNPNNAQTKTLSVKKWNGTTWQTIGLPSELYPTSLLGYDLEIHPVTGVPYVCFIDGNAPNPGNINIRKWNGQNWVSISNSNLLGTLGEKIDLVFQPQTNIPHVISTSGQLLKCVEATASLKDVNMVNIAIYPNPARSEVEIKGTEVKKVSVFDIRGVEVLVASKARFAIKKLKTGLYFLVINNNQNQRIIKKLVVQ